MGQKLRGKQDDFLRLLARLSPERERAWQEYARLRQKLVMFFEPHLEAEELAEDVLDRIAQKEDTYPISNVTEFAFGVARNLRKETYRRDQAKVSVADDEDLPAGKSKSENTLIDAIDTEKKRRCFSLCLEHLNPEQRRWIFEYFPADDWQLDERRHQLAQKLNLSGGALRTRMTRLREKLENCCGRCVGGQRKNGTRPGLDQ